MSIKIQHLDTRETIYKESLTFLGFTESKLKSIQLCLIAFVKFDKSIDEENNLFKKNIKKENISLSLERF